MKRISSCTDMVRNIALILLCFIAASAYSQKTFDNDFYINATRGFVIPVKNTDGAFDGLNLSYSHSDFGKGSLFIEFNNRIGLHLNIIGIEYWRDISKESIQSEYPDYFLLGEDYSYKLYKFATYCGLAYKFNYRRFVMIPYFDLGFISHATSSIDSYFLKESGSNNIKQIDNSSSIRFSKFDYTLGTDLYFHFGKYWGAAATVQYDRFSVNTDFITVTRDYYSADLNTTDNMNFKHHNILVSFGLFFSFMSNKRTDVQLNNTTGNN